MGCLPLETCCPLSTSRTWWFWFFFPRITCIPDWNLKALDNTTCIHLLRHCQLCQGCLSSLCPFPTQGRCSPQIPDEIQCAGSHRPPQTTGIWGPTRLEGLRQHWKHSLVQPHWHFLLPITKAGRFCHPSESIAGAWSRAGFVSLGFIWGPGGVPPFSSHKCTIL